MSIAVSESAFVGKGGQTIGLSSMFSVTAGTGNPQYLVLTGLDRNEYTAGASDATGKFNGNGASDSFGNGGGDARTAGIVFTYQASSGRYYNSIYGYFDQMTYTTSTGSGDVTNLSLFGTNNLSVANADAANPSALVQLDGSGYLGSVTLATQPGFTGAVPSQATPNSICAAAEAFVGKVWNSNGCWLLASTIAADAGASLPVASSMIGVGGQNNGEWFVAFDGSKQTGNWQSMVTAGEVIVIGSGSSGHITTCVSGSGSTAMLVDNATFVSNGKVTNSANDGSSSDIVVAAAHAASQEWAQAVSSDVVIYELDAPVVSDLVTSAKLLFNSKEALSLLFSAKDPAGKVLTQYQVYDTAGSDSFVVNGATQSAHSAATAVTTTSLSSISLVAGAVATTDTVDVRAFNGSYWGDWQTLNVAVAAAAPPVVTNQTAAQVWTAGQHVSLALPGNTFVDPNGQTMTLTATQSNGQALPSWLSFSASTDTFTGVAPTAASSFTVKVMATDASGLSASETFAASVSVAPAASTVSSLPYVAHPTAPQLWTDGQNVSFTLASNTFVDPHGLKMSYTAYAIGTTAVESWLTFNPATETFNGKVPAGTVGAVLLEVVATDTSGASAVDMIAVSLGAAGSTAATVVGVPQFSAAHTIALHA